jgi:hypothetical protein
MLSGLQKYWDNTDKRGAGSATETALAGFPSFYKHLFAKISEGGTV